MQTTERLLTDIIDVDAKSYAMYTVENRAIPNMIDGLKPVQRFMIYRALAMGKGNAEKFHKLASVAGGVADAGYHHGENSAQESGALMANTWNNNFPLLDGQGNFGSRLVQKAAASRYVFCRISSNFRKVYKDFDIAPAHEDVEHLPPKFYLPIIPMVLINGVKGIATGYSTTILPHSVKSVIECTRLAINGTLDKEAEVSYPEFSGKVVRLERGKYALHGVYKFTSKTQLFISEIPYSFDRARYVEKVLDPLEDNGLITYEDACSKSGFGFKIKLRKEFSLPESEYDIHEKIMSTFKLVEKVSQNIVVIDENGRLNDSFATSTDLINAFVKVRMKYIDKRILFMIDKSKHVFELSLAKALFIKEVNAGKIVVKGKTKAQLKEELSKMPVLKGFEDQLVAMNIYHMTSDEETSLKEKARAARAEMQYWQETTAAIEYSKDLDEIEKLIG